jgi:hypothetical protein
MLPQSGGLSSFPVEHADVGRDADDGDPLRRLVSTRRKRRPMASVPGHSFPAIVSLITATGVRPAPSARPGNHDP